MTIYLDHNASTPLAESVRAAMAPFLDTRSDSLYANPSGLHRQARLVRDALERAREQVAALVNAHPSQVIFTSGATEANNLALKGWAAAAIRPWLAVSAVEHASVLAPARALARRGVQVACLAVDGDGRVTPETLEEGLAAWTRTQPRRAMQGLVSVMYANNETGVLQDVETIAEEARRAGAVVHCDAAQAAGKVALDFQASGVHMMSLSAHKLNGPKGAGALILDRSVALEPLQHGGGHEQELRAGTENVAAIVGFGAAAELARRELAARRERMQALRKRLEGRLKAIPQVIVFAERAPRLPNTTCLAVPGLEGEALVMQLDRRGIAVSSGSSCSSGTGEPSHVLQAMGVDPEQARCAVRVSLGPDNRPSDVDALVSALEEEIRDAGLEAGLQQPALQWAPL